MGNQRAIEFWKTFGQGIKNLADLGKLILNSQRKLARVHFISQNLQKTQELIQSVTSGGTELGYGWGIWRD